jgi:ABC-type branched-subunit amino acid transport system ATPase component/sugar phosphate permease
LSEHRALLEPTAVEPEALVAVVLEEEGRRHAEQQERVRAERAVSADLLAGVGREKMAFREVARRGGVGTLALLCGIPLADALSGATFGVLAPDIQKSLDLSLEQVGLIGTLGGLMVLVAAIPLGRLADSYRRWPIVGVCTLVVAVFTFLTGFVHSAWALAGAAVVAGLGKGNEGPVQASLVADAFPLEGRNRLFGMIRGAQGLGGLIGPALVGGIAALAGGEDGWRWPFFVLGFPFAVLGVLAFFMKEPRRGRQEMLAVLGEELTVDVDELPIPLRSGFARLKKVRSFNYQIVAISVVGFNFVAVALYSGIFLDERFGLDAGERGLVGSLGAVGALVGVIVGGTLGDRMFARSPAAPTRVGAVLIAASGVVGAASYFMPNPPLYTLLVALGSACTMGGFVIMQSTGVAIMPYRLRATGMAMFFLYLALFGGLGGSLLVSQLEKATGLQVALATVAAAASVVGGAILLLGSRFIGHDMALASADLLEEREELRRVAAGAATPLLQVRNLDFSYGPVQVLFDVSIDVWEGEVLALLGTNGAGKSTVLNSITGLGQADRGHIRLAGKTLTFAEPGTRLAHGIVAVPGGKATFPNLSVADNLQARGFSVPRRELDARLAKALELFPVLSERLDQPAGTLSGGEQQMLAIAGALLLNPRVLLIDELSLGLAPIVVQQLLEVVEKLKEDGMTMVIVEQSLNVALSIADRAVFMEKGQVRFQGPAKELMERDDLVRAVFLGGEVG